MNAHSSRPTRTSAHLRLAIASLLACTAAPASIAFAQSTDTLDQIIVSATRRDEDVQRVPVAVSILSGADLERANRTNVNSIASQVPTVNFRTQSSNKDTSLFIRGVGTISTSPGVESSVSTVIDGVVYGARGQATLDLLDIERVEILRGPQGTLFGKNASAGVISIVTRAPSSQPGGFFDLSYFGGGDEIRVRSGVAGQLSKSVSASFSGLYATYDGNVKNVRNGENVNGYRHTGGRAKFQIEPSDDLRITLSADYVHSNDDVQMVITGTTLTAYPTGAVTHNPGFAAALGPVVPRPDNRSINSDMHTHVEDDNWGVAAQVDWQIGDYTLTSITAFRNWNNVQFQDGDRLGQIYQEFARSHDRGDLDFKQYSQELRIASPQGRFVDYVAGLYWFKGVDEETYRRNVTRCSGSTLPAIAPGATPCEEGSATFVEDFGRADYGTRNINYAVFGEATFNFTDSFRALAGIRWTHDDLEYDHARVSSASATNSVPGIRAPYASEGSTSEDGYSGRAGLQYDFTDDVTAYVTYSRGYKGPAYNVYFNMQAIDTPVLAPEESDSYEIGLKSRLFGNRATANLALFDTTYDNYQANYFDLVGTTVVTRLINAGEVRTRGVELDFNARPIPELTLSGGVAYTHARIKNFNCPPGAAASCAVNGKPLPYSPDWKANVSALYVVPLTALVNWDLEIGTDFNWQSETQYDIAQSPDAIQGAYGIWNASIALTQPQQGWRASLVVKNITDKSYASFLGTGGQFINRVVPRDDQRYFGISLRKDF
jgi:iron complex outermembrane receptor protein